MNLSLVLASAASLAALTLVGGLRLDAAPTAPEGAAALVGQGLFASEEPIDRWGDPVRAEDLALEPLGRVAGVLTAADGTPEGVVVAVGGLWGLGSREVSVGMERVHLLGSEDGEARLVVDLSAEGAAPLPG